MNFLGDLSFLPLSNTLEIKNATLQHSGAYKCIARNGWKSRASQIASLEVQNG